jgi:hypothetical protein
MDKRHLGYVGRLTAAGNSGGTVSDTRDRIGFGDSSRGQTPGSDTKLGSRPLADLHRLSTRLRLSGITRRRTIVFRPSGKPHGR